MRLEELTARIDGPKKKTGTGYVVRCPAHADKEPSLHVSAGADRLLLKCHAGCTVEAICEAMEVGLADLFYEEREKQDRPAPQPKRLIATYDYADENGEVLYRKLRFEPKTFGWERREGDRWVSGLGEVRRVPFGLPALAAAKPGDTAWLCEGEKDCVNLRAAGAGIVTSTKDWQDEWSTFFRGLNVVIIQDNDDPGRKIAAQVSKSLGDVPASLLVMTMPGAFAGGDVSDYLRGGGTFAGLKALAAKRPDAFVSSPDRASNEREERIKIGPRILSFGIPYLDHALTGIAPEDVILCSAKTGAGKTEAASTIGLSVARAGKRVHLFALEAGHLEIERRIKYRLISNLYYEGYNPSRRPIRYQEWAAGLMDDVLGEYEKKAQERFEAETRNLFTFYKSGDFTGGDFLRVAARIAEETDLIILDHLHYVDSDDTNENAGYKKITKQIRDSALTHGKPVLVVAHVRKGDRYSQQLVPGVEDIHGSSDISKIATKAFMLARAEDQPHEKKHISNTYIQVVKNRTDGSVCRYVAMVGFDLRTNTYCGDYDLFRPIDGGKAMAILSADETPYWAKGARNPVSGFVEPPLGPSMYDE